MNAESAAEGAPERVCIVIWDRSVSEAELRRYLDDLLPLRLERWQDHTDLSTIEQLRPRVIVVVEPNDELAADTAGLLACLITAYTPTIIGMTLAYETSDVAEELEDALHSSAHRLPQALALVARSRACWCGSLGSARARGSTRWPTSPCAGRGDAWRDAPTPHLEQQFGSNGLEM